MRKWRYETTEESIGKFEKCPDCGLDIPFDAEVCPYCGRGFNSEKVGHTYRRREK